MVIKNIRGFTENVSGYSRNPCSLNRERDAAFAAKLLTLPTGFFSAEKSEMFSFIGNSTLRGLHALGKIYQTCQAEKRCLSGPIMNQQHTVSSNRQDLGTWSRINVKVVKLDKSVRRGPSCRNTNIFQENPSKKSLRGGYTPSRMRPKTKR